MRPGHCHANRTATVHRLRVDLSAGGIGVRALPAKGVLGAEISGDISGEVDLSKTATKEETREAMIARLTDERLDVMRQISDTEAEYKAELLTLRQRLANVEAEFRGMFPRR
jgi:hypothetical protein